VSDPAAFGGSPPSGGGEYIVPLLRGTAAKRQGVAHTRRVVGVIGG